MIYITSKYAHVLALDFIPQNAPSPDTASCSFKRSETHMVSLSLCAPRRLRKQSLHIDVSTSGEDEDYHAAEDAYGHFPCDALDHSTATEDGLTHAPNLKDDDDFVFSPSPAIKTARALGLQDRGEGEGRAAYSQVAGNFDLGGFKIGASGLVSSPRNRGRRRPSLNEGDNFVILARLGSGSSSSVHKALHLPTMRLVALKSLPLYDAERRAQLMRELRVLYSNLASINSSRKGRGGQRNDREAALHEGAADNTTENTGAYQERHARGFCIATLDPAASFHLGLFWLPIHLPAEGPIQYHPTFSC